ncbi:hypothetical protein VH1709_contig00008-0216 [Vibrio harveyi]|jgi:hypothetical protein|uniref:Uncharacterized protein n=1 Tax=Vibrio harveyi TaxID=669 RepID=A0A1E3DNU8_VIBHA|nr:hypothetical protein LA59_12130 [Vibrio harveyi]KIF45680.1 hypothetical protein M445_20295 [Vibrio owensii 47666-1]AMF96963.1 hypothetical protein AL538_04035 [Vibrio harveyi]APP05154.1 hypothetical protein BG259_07280 [Vibrio harveyi]AWA99949.1 hypothetical protein CU052_11880 [Vibrio harveyi]
MGCCVYSCALFVHLIIIINAKSQERKVRFNNKVTFVISQSAREAVITNKQRVKNHVAGIKNGVAKSTLHFNELMTEQED